MMNTRKEKVVLYAVVGLAVLVPLVWFFFWRNVAADLGQVPNDGGDEGIEESRQDPMPSSATIVGEGAFQEVEAIITGDVLVMQSDEQYVVRLANFKSENCENCYVYFSDNEELDGLTNLGDLEARVGDMNYQVPHEANVRAFEEVLIWDEASEKILARAEIAWTE